MRTPIWILDFNKNGTASDFFDRWWKAYVQNATEKPEEIDKWFHVTPCAGKSYEEVLKEAGHLTLRRADKEPLIPVFSSLANPKVLTVVFIGDVTDELETIPKFHFWAARLRSELLKDETQWTTVPNVRFYGMLWRPNTAAVAPGVSAKTRGFLQELNMLMKEDVNHAPFRSVAFVESADRAEDKAAAMEKINLAVLHLSAHDYLGDDPRHRYVDLSATGVFYEAAVHAQQGEFLLSSALMDKIAHSRDKEFFNASAAQTFVDTDAEFLNIFEGSSLIGNLKEDCPKPENKTYAYDLVPGISPWSSKIRKVWDEYYCDFIPNYKRNLVNRVKRSLATFVRDYREKLYANQKETITRVSGLLQKQVFSIFTGGKHSDYVSVAQATEILTRYRRKIDDIKDEADSVKFSPFKIPAELKKAADQARVENRSPQEAIDVLENKIAHHPVAVFALLVRAVVLGILLWFIGWTILPNVMELTPALIISVVLGLLPLGVSLLQFRSMQIRIRALKDQYVGVMLLRAEDELRKDIVECLKTTYIELLQYCDWLKANKLEFLKNHLSVLSPTEFSFIESPVRQPLIKTGSSTHEEESVVLIPPVTPEALDDIELSGSFGRYPLLAFDATSPMHTVSIEGINKDIKAVVKSDKDLKYLIGRLLSERTTVRRSIEREATFLSRDVQGKTLLLLDVSGSMSGQPLENLKKAVHSLEESYQVEWIAFDDKVVASSFDEDADIDRLQSGGGTNFIPPIELAAQKVLEAVYDDIILISDGSPFEKTEDILTAAYKLQQPLNTISIGNDGASVMKELSDRTNGTQIVVTDVREIIHWEGKMQAVVQLGENGEFSFGELIAKCHIPGCARAMRSFVSSRIMSEATSLASLITRYPGKGLQEWALATRKGATLSQTHEVLDDEYLLGVNQATSQDSQFAEVIARHLEGPTIESLEGPLMLVTLVSARGVSLRDLVWAGLDETCSDINDREQLRSLLYEGTSICNLYDRQIR